MAMPEIVELVETAKKKKAKWQRNFLLALFFKAGAFVEFEKTTSGSRESEAGLDSFRGVWDGSAPVFPAPLHELHHGAAPSWSSWSRCYSIKNVELVEYP
jgi:hypothetical protein